MATATDKLAAQLRAQHKNGHSEKKERFQFPEGHMFVFDSEQMNFFLDVAGHLYDTANSHVASKFYAIIRNAPNQKI